MPWRRCKRFAPSDQRDPWPPESQVDNRSLFVPSRARIGLEGGMTEQAMIILAGLALVVAAITGLAVVVLRRPRSDEADRQMADLARLQAEILGRMQAMGETLAGRQSELARVVNERLDSVS